MKKSKEFLDQSNISPTAETIQTPRPKRLFRSEKKENFLSKLDEAINLVLQSLQLMLMEGDHNDESFIAPLSARERKFKKLGQIAANYGTNSRIFTQELITCIMSVNIMLVECRNHGEIYNKINQAKRILNNLSSTNH